MRYRQLLLLLLLLSGIAGCARFMPSASPSEPSTSGGDRNTIVVDTAALTAQYQHDVAVALAPYWATGMTTSVKDAVLELRVPQDLLDVHFQLVLALEQLEQAEADDDETRIATAHNALAQLQEAHSWMIQIIP